ncbi:MAG: hypothetical protein WBF79_04425 [Rhodococcus sp. (in: high G+C Gram-positive bacteria)]
MGLLGGLLDALTGGELLDGGLTTLLGNLGDILDTLLGAGGTGSTGSGS